MAEGVRAIRKSTITMRSEKEKTYLEKTKPYSEKAKPKNLSENKLVLITCCDRGHEMSKKYILVKPKE
jgi:hypothetical protein